MSISKPVLQSQLAFHCMLLCLHIDGGEFHVMDLQTFLSSYHRCFKRYSKSSLNRQQEVAHYSTPPQLRLVDYLQKRKDKKGAQQYDLKISKAGNVSVLRHRWVNLAINLKNQHTNTTLFIFQCVDMWKQNPCYLTAPSEVDVSLVVTFCNYQQLYSVVLYEGKKEVAKSYPISNSNN